MLKENLNELIKNAMLEKNKTKLETLRAVKTAFLNFETAKNAKPLDEAAEIQLIRKLISQREEARDQFNAAGRIELADKEQAVLTEFLPKPVEPEEIENFVKTLITPGVGKKDMGRLVKETKTKFPTAEGKIIADLVKKLLDE